MSNPLGYFEKLGARIEASFRAANYLEDSLIEIAVRELEADPADRSVNPTNLLEFVASGGVLPSQFSSDLSFGQPPLTVFSAPRFVIDVYFWFEGTTATHQHAFCGAFQVLAGSSLHSVRNFRCERQVNGFFLLGHVETQHCEVLQVGDVRRIRAGEEFGHALFHLDQPSVTVVVRTRVNPRSGPQYNYAAPYVAYDPFHKPFTRLLQSASSTALLKVCAERHTEAVSQRLRTATVEDTYFTLEQEALRELELPVDENESYQQLRHVAEECHGRETIDKLTATIAQTQLVKNVFFGRRFTSDPDERFLLAVLTNSHSRAQVLQFTESRFPDREPTMAFMSLFESMASQRDDREENALGFDLSKDAMQIVALMVHGVRREDIPRRMVEAGHASDKIAKQVGALLKFYDMLRATTVVGVLAQ